MPNGNSPWSTYPFALHDTSLSLPWGIEITAAGKALLRSTMCSGEARDSGQSCKACARLERNNVLRGVVERMEKGVKEGTGLAYHGFGTLHEVVRRKNRRVEFFRLRGLNYSRKLATQATALDDHKRLLIAVASKKVERLDRILRVGLREKRGIRTLLDRVLKAAEGLYKPKDYEEEDYLRGMLLWRLGGNRLATIAHRALGLPSVTTLKNQVRIPPIHISPAQPTAVEVAKNVENVFDGMEEVLALRNGAARHHAVLMFDEIATEKRLRWDPRLDRVVGVCREHAHKAPLELRSGEDVKEVYQSLDEGRIHYAGEVSSRRNQI